jgi:hypothetical protein
MTATGHRPEGGFCVNGHNRDTGALVWKQCEPTLEAAQAAARELAELFPQDIYTVAKAEKDA